MMLAPEHILDWQRGERTGIPEAVFASGKTYDRICSIVEEAVSTGRRLLITRLDPAIGERLAARFGKVMSFDAASSCAVVGEPTGLLMSGDIAVVSAGTSDLPVAYEAVQTLRFHGHEPAIFSDVGVAGLWRLLDRMEAIRQSSIIIAVAGMEGALFSVLGGLVEAPVIAVPTSVGYGVARDGKAALHAALASCAPGIVVVNVDNGFGAAAAALKLLAVAKRYGMPKDN